MATKWMDNFPKPVMTGIAKIVTSHLLLFSSSSPKRVFSMEGLSFFSN